MSWVDNPASRAAAPVRSTEARTLYVCQWGRAGAVNEDVPGLRAACSGPDGRPDLGKRADQQIQAECEVGIVIAPGELGRQAVQQRERGRIGLADLPRHVVWVRERRCHP